MMLRIANIVGTRPNFMKIAPLLHVMRQREGVDPVLIHTGQHYDEAMSGRFLEALEIPEPDHRLSVGSGSHAVQTAEAMVALERVFDEVRPDVVVVVGDVNSTLAAALVAAKGGFPLAHVEAGLRSHDRSMPEEMNRIVVDALSDLLFATERQAVGNLVREGVAEERIFFVGNVMIDTLLRHRARAEALDVPGRFGVSVRGYALVTLHRPSNVDAAPSLERFLGVLEALGARLPVLFPVHPRTRAALERFGQWDRARSLRNVRVLEPQGYLEFLGLMAQARLVLTDSGGIQEETTALGVPCLTVRENTERPITIREGTNRLVGTDPARILEAAAEVLEPGAALAPRRPELWDGRASERIVDILMERVPGGR